MSKSFHDAFVAEYDNTRFNSHKTILVAPPVSESSLMALVGNHTTKELKKLCAAFDISATWYNHARKEQLVERIVKRLRTGVKPRQIAATAGKLGSDSFMSEALKLMFDVTEACPTFVCGDQTVAHPTDVWYFDTESANIGRLNTDNMTAVAESIAHTMEPPPWPLAEPTPEPVKEPTVTQPVTPTPAPAAATGLDGILKAIITESIGDEVKNELSKMGITQEKVEDLIMGVLNKSTMPSVVKRVDPAPGEPTLELAHTCLKKAQFYLDGGDSIYLNGPAGSGKTEASRQLARIYDLDLTIISCTGDMTVYDIVGYNDGHGKYNPTPFYHAWCEGHFILIDEVDKAPGEVTVFLNAATEQGLLTFPNGEQVEKKDGCKIVLTGNTKLSGADSIYNTANKQDGSFANRLIPVAWPYDEYLEECLAIRASLAWGGNERQAKESHNAIKKIRKVTDEFGMNYIVGQRQTMKVAQTVARGLSLEEAVEDIVYGWMDENDADRVREGVKHA